MINHSVPLIFAPVASTSGLRQRKTNGRAAARALTGGELAEQKRTCVTRSNHQAGGEATQECIVVSSTAPA